MVVSAFFELRQSRQELYHVMEEEALSLAEIIDGSSRNIILTTEQIESQLAARLFNNAYFIARLDSLGLLTNGQLVSFAAANSIFRINIFDKDGKKSLSNYVPHGEHAGLTARHSPMDYIRPILNGDTDRLTIGLKESRFTNEQRFAIAIRRTKRSGGAIVLNLDAADLLEFRKTVGIGKLLRDLGDNSGIEYVALQDPEGIIAASRAVKELSSFDDDALLIPLMQKDTSITRTVTFEGRNTYEVLRPLILNNVAVGILRIGLSTEEIRATEERMKRRLGTMSVVLIGLGALVMTAIVANQNYRMTKRKLTTVETFTGSILEHMQDGVVALDAEGKVSLFNKKAQELFGTSEEMMLGKTLDDLLGTTAASVRQLFTVTQNDSELSIRDGNDRERYLSVSVSRTANEKGAVESTTAVVRDLTEARRLQQEMQRNEKLSAMGELASGVAHEIRNPLNAIAMIAQRYESEFVPQEGVPEYLSLTKVLKSEVQRVNGIIRQFLGFARPPKLNLQEVHSTTLVHRLATLFEGQARAKGIQFTVTNACDVNLRCDFEQMTQALLNLLQNALDATSRGGAIDLHCSVNGQRVQFSVKDSGVGIPKERLDKIFNLYYSTKPDGTGLGLAITHQIASQHEGNIEVESKEGNGSRFIVSLPLNNT
jgi:two-component system, NtrC family, sensor histidine kinase HydH